MKKTKVKGEKRTKEGREREEEGTEVEAAKE